MNYSDCDAMLILCLVIAGIQFVTITVLATKLVRVQRKFNWYVHGTIHIRERDRELDRLRKMAGID